MITGKPRSTISMLSVMLSRVPCSLIRLKKRVLLQLNKFLEKLVMLTTIPSQELFILTQKLPQLEKQKKNLRQLELNSEKEFSHSWLTAEQRPTMILKDLLRS